MSDCLRFGMIVPLFTGGELPAADAKRVAEHIAGCPQCQAEEANFHRLREMARGVERLDKPGLPDAVRLKIALQAAERAGSRSWIVRVALAAMDAPIRPALSAAAAAAVLIALLVVPQHTFNRSGSRPAGERVLRIDVVAEAGQVRLAWVDGHKEMYTIEKSPDPRTFSPREAFRVDGNVWIDQKPDTWPVVFYRIE